MRKAQAAKTIQAVFLGALLLGILPTEGKANQSVLTFTDDNFLTPPDAGWWGWAFHANASLQVTALQYYYPASGWQNSQSHFVAIFSVDNLATPLISTTISQNDNINVTLSTPWATRGVGQDDCSILNCQLTAGNNYYILGQDLDFEEVHFSSSPPTTIAQIDWQYAVSATGAVLSTLNPLGTRNGFFGPNFVVADNFPVATVPEPGTWALGAIGLLGVWYARRRRARS